MMSQSDTKHFLHAIRQATPYIQKYSGKTFVIHLSALIWQSAEIEDFWQDLVLCNCLGISLVLVIDSPSSQTYTATTHKLDNHHIKITKPEDINNIKLACNQTVLEVQNKLGLAQANTTVKNKHFTTVVSGNWLMAEPIGVIDGLDYRLTGHVSHVQNKAIKQNLENGHIVTIVPLGLGITGETFHLNSHAVSIAVAKSLGADKLILFDKTEYLKSLPSQLLPYKILHTNCNDNLKYWLLECKKILVHVPKVHLVSVEHPTQLLQELFTNKGCGTLLQHTAYDEITLAKTDDIPCIMELIEPYVYKGALTFKPYDFLKDNISSFCLIKNNGTLIGCAGLVAYENHYAELLALAVHPQYLKLNVGTDLLKQIINKAKKEHIKTIFALTTQTSHWFIKNKFVKSTIDTIPASKLSQLQLARNSHIYLLDLTQYDQYD